MFRHMTKITVCILLSIVWSGYIFSTDVEYYKMITSLTDQSKVKMTEDLFYTQLLSFQGYNVVDKRPAQYEGDLSNKNPDTIFFYVSIQEENNQWHCTLYAGQPQLNKKAEVTHTYDSFFKILTEAKPSIQNILDQLSTKQSASVRQGLSVITPTYDSIAGTWVGEPTINKIVLLRGGRGFVIFNNGASMNISVEIRGNTVICTQSGQGNASYFPDIPREMALVAALDATPIVWTMQMTNENTMVGTKESLKPIQQGNDLVGVETGTSSVTWSKQ